MKEATRLALAKLLRDSVTTGPEVAALQMRAQAIGMLSALLHEETLSASAHSAELILVELAAAQRAELKGTI